MFVRRNLTLVGALFCAVGLVGCMTYDFEPVQPLAIAQTSQVKKVIAKQLKPDVMILLDKSGSMNDPIPAAQCSGGGACTRMSEMQSAMNTFLSTSGTSARFGLMTFPSPAGECAASAIGDIKQPLPPSADPDSDPTLQSLANNVKGSINSTVPGGGTPTGGSLRNLGAYGPLLGEEREDFILLLTDGLPNCNASNPNDYKVDANACRCTLANPPVSCGSTMYSKLGCLDKDNSVQAITELRAKKIRTIVIGFSSEVGSGDGQEVLNAMAEAGGFPRTCPNGTDAECGSNNTCDAVSKLCQKRFFQTGNSQELAAALKKIADEVTVSDPCVYKLESAPSDPKLLAVLVDGNAVATGNDTWLYSASAGTPIVTFKGALCTQLSSATPQAPVNLEFRIIEGL